MEYLHSKFLINAEKYPDNIALVVDDSHLTYKEVKEKALNWSHSIQTNNKVVKRVGIFAYKSEVSYIGILASLLAGATFVPLNPNFPIERTYRMIKEANLDAIFIGKESKEVFKKLMDSYMDLEIPLAIFPDLKRDELLFSIKSKVVTTDNLKNFAVTPSEAQNINEIAYLMFTSGSTGKPKGVPISHRNILHFLNVSQEKFNINIDDRLSQTFDLTFDLAIFDIFMAWSNGASLYPLKDLQLLSPIKFLKKHSITVWFSVPYIITLLRKQNLLKPNTIPSLRLSLFCGEPLYVNAAEFWSQAAPNSIIENLYGPTELTVSCTSYTWRKEQIQFESNNGIVPIGKINRGLKYIILNEELKNLEKGEIGELCVAGPQTFQGYLNNIESTNKNLITVEGEIFYRTGDLVKELKNGELVYIGRMDSQIKFKGYRIECSEIEGALLSFENVLSSAVIPWPIEELTVKGLVAFVTGTSINKNEILKELEKKLPVYMLPTEIFLVDKFPLNSNGKIDRNQLRMLLEESIYAH